jgi:hypothetical protein
VKKHGSFERRETFNVSGEECASGDISGNEGE